MKKLIYCLPLLLLLAACSKSENKATSEAAGSYNAQIHHYHYWISNTSDHSESDSDYVATVQIADVGSDSVIVAFPNSYGDNESAGLHLDQNTADSLIYNNSSSYGQFDSYSVQLRFGKATRRFTFSYKKTYRATSWNTVTYTIQGQP